MKKLYTLLDNGIDKILSGTGFFSVVLMIPFLAYKLMESFPLTSQLGVDNSES